MNKERIFVTAIGTDSGKTLVSAILVEALEADYWKPIQAGRPRDTDTVSSLVSNQKTKFHPESHFLNTPASPHAAAKIDNVHIRFDDIQLPHTNNDLVIEGAGGALVPLNDDDYVIDLVSHLGARVLLVSNLYLGSINHTLLTVEALKARGLDVMGIVFNGLENEESQSIILNKSGYRHLLSIPQLSHVGPVEVKEYASILSSSLGIN